MASNKVRHAFRKVNATPNTMEKGIERNFPKVSVMDSLTKPYVKPMPVDNGAVWASSNASTDVWAKAGDEWLATRKYGRRSA